MTRLVLVALFAATCAPPAGSSSPVSPSASSAVTPPASASPTEIESGPPTASSSAALPSTSDGLPDFPSIWIIVLENHGFDQVVGSADMPYLNGLIDRYGLAQRSSGVSRPSQPNYFALFSGSTQDVHDNDPHDIDAPTVADQIEASGRTWKEYAENRPSGCFTGPTASGGRDGDGGYRRKHAPAISFDAIRNDPARCANLVDLTAFRPDGADFSLIIPNQCHAAHDCGLGDADRWLAGFVPRIVDSPTFSAGGLLIVTFDEDAGNDPGGGHIATVVASPAVAPGFRSDQPHDHYGVLRTIEDAWGLECLAESCDARPLDEFFATP
ncbi:MAG TPA: alkaline phosphatase family protein [Candidatus Limnocylindrales bacterium]|nr:alkaline phosphatase family protein [Candidatus Limnocylindrales bacterium]